VRPHLSIIVPAFNESEAIAAGKLEEVLGWCQRQPFLVELLVVDDGSEDDTAELAHEQLEGSEGRVVRIPHAGKAAAIMRGIEASKAETLLFTDMDLATPIEQASGLVAAIDGGADIAIGSRGYLRKGAPIGRRVMSAGQVILRSLLLGFTLPDTQCGFKAFRRTVAGDVLEHLQAYHPTKIVPRRGPSVTSGFDVEFLFVATRLGYHIQVVPVDWHYEVSRRVDLRNDAFRGARDLLAICAARLRRAYPPRQKPTPSRMGADVE